MGTGRKLHSVAVAENLVRTGQRPPLAILMALTRQRPATCSVTMAGCAAPTGVPRRLERVVLGVKLAPSTVWEILHEAGTPLGRPGHRRRGRLPATGRPTAGCATPPGAAYAPTATPTTSAAPSRRPPLTRRRRPPPTRRRRPPRTRRRRPRAFSPAPPNAASTPMPSSTLTMASYTRMVISFASARSVQRMTGATGARSTGRPMPHVWSDRANQASVRGTAWQRGRRIGAPRTCGHRHLQGRQHLWSQIGHQGSPSRHWV